MRSKSVLLKIIMIAAILHAPIADSEPSSLTPNEILNRSINLNNYPIAKDSEIHDGTLILTPANPTNSKPTDSKEKATKTKKRPLH